MRFADHFMSAFHKSQRDWLRNERVRIGYVKTATEWDKDGAFPQHEDRPDAWNDNGEPMWDIGNVGWFGRGSDRDYANDSDLDTHGLRFW